MDENKNEHKLTYEYNSQPSKQSKCIVEWWNDADGGYEAISAMLTHIDESDALFGMLIFLENLAKQKLEQINADEKRLHHLAHAVHHLSLFWSAANDAPHEIIAKHKARFVPTP